MPPALSCAADPQQAVQTMHHSAARSRISWQALASALTMIAVCVALTIALDQGIQIGRENHAGMLPVVRRLLDATYLPGDFGIEIRMHHHRVFAILVATLARFIGEQNALAWLTVVGYALIFAGLWRLGGALQMSRSRRLLFGVALAAGMFYLDRGVEANRFLGNGPIMPPTFAHALIIFGIDAIVRQRWNLAFVLAGGTALLHLQIGAIWWLLLAVEALRQRVWRRPAEWLPGFGCALVIMSPALMDLWVLAQQGLTRGISTLDDVSLRMPQHFEFNAGRVAIVAVYLTAFICIWRRWRELGDARAERFAPLVWMASALAALTVLHYFDYYLLGSGWIARLQLLRLSVFLPVLAGLALLAALPDPATHRFRNWPWLAAGMIAALALGADVYKGAIPTLRVHDYAQDEGDWADICRWVRREGPHELYVTPPGQTGFTAWSDRSTLVEFKINPDGGAGLAEWRQRLLAVSGGALPQQSTRKNVAAALDRDYARLSTSAFADLERDYGVRIAIVPAASALQGRVLYENRGYRVVALSVSTPAG